MSEKLIKFWPIIFLFFLTFLLRIAKIDELFYFTYDESIPAFVGRRLIIWGHVPLIGGVTPFNFHLGPYFYWFYALILFFGKLNPIAWGWLSAIIAVVTTSMMYLIGKTIGSKKIGITAAIFWAFSYLTNIYDRHLWALYWGPLISLITLFSLIKITMGKEKFVYLLGATIALAIHADPSNLVFLAFAIVVWLIYKIPVKKSTFIALGIILFSFLPLVVFDLRHNFTNTRPVIDFWNQGRNNPDFDPKKFVNNSLIFPRAFTRLIYTFGDSEVAKQYSYCRNYVAEKFDAIPWYFAVAGLLLIVVFVLKHLRDSPLRSEVSRIDSSEVEQKSGFQLITLLIIFYFLGIQLYGTIFQADVFEHYITGLFAVFLLIFAKLVCLLPRKLWLITIAVFVSLNLAKLASAKNSIGFENKKHAIEWTMQQVGEKDFSLDSLSTCWKYSGYRYLFVVFGREPVKSYVDPNFAYLYGTTPVAEKHPETVVTFVVHDFAPETDEFYRRYALLKSHEVKSAIFGNIEVIIMDNSSEWFDQPATLKNPNIPISKD